MSESPHRDNAFQHTLPSEEVAEEELHHQIHPWISQAANLKQSVPKGQTRAQLLSSSTSASASTLNQRMTEQKN